MELVEIVDRFLDARRARAAFYAVHMDVADLETSRLKRLLLAIMADSAEPIGHFKLDSHDISTALKSLDGRAGVTRDEMARLEFMFIDALDHSEHGIPNLERQITESPPLFVQVVALVYKRRGDGDDPPEWRIDDPDRRAALAAAAYRLLQKLRLIPGTDRDGKIESNALRTWIVEVRHLFEQYGRSEIGDYCIGELLSRAPVGEDEVWPCLPVRDAMETTASQSLSEGFSIGVRNAVGVQYRGEDGAQEREQAAKYRGWARQLRYDHPYVSTVLESIAVSYDRDANREDSRANVRKRIGH